MITFERILYPADLSPRSRAMAPAVAAMARRFRSQLVLLHVTGESSSHAADFEDFEAPVFSDIPVTRELLEGDPADQIVRYAEAHNVDLIMMPTHGHGAFRALLLGSVTAKVLHDSHCPVWTGVHSEELTAHSPDRWKRILCAIDTNEHGATLLKWAADFARDQNVEIQLVHAVAGTDSVWLEQREPSMYEFLFHAARERVAALQASAETKLEVHLIGGSVGSAVRQAAQDYVADLVVSGRGAIQTSLGRLKNNAYSIIRTAPCPVISV